ncbi:MAG: nucleotidyltransferase [Halanaerobiaceae bacterium]|nr:nucleotidyltransferase [Halanaerobiaceae bacterium]
MGTVAVISEYNPFHNGHLYHLKKAREISKADSLIVIMNGNFVQRGEPALLDKWNRTRMALAGGADLVIELPLVYGIRSAEYFARGAVGILDKSNIVDSIVFGSELGKIEPLQEIARILIDKKRELQEKIQEELAGGKSFPLAREAALQSYLQANPDLASFSASELLEIISEPNNILAIEYLKSLRELTSAITPYTIKRIGSGYHDKKTEGKYASATAIRELVYRGELDNIKTYLPEEPYHVLIKAIEKGQAPAELEHFSLLLIASIRKFNTKELEKFAELDNGLERRVYREAHRTTDFKNLVRKIKTKAYTWTRIQRNLLHIFFDIKEEDFRLLDRYGPQYIRVLGVRKERTDLLSKLNKKAGLPVIINPAEFLREIDLESQDPLLKSLSYDILASDIYSLLYKNPACRQGNLDFTKALIKY